MPIQKIRKYFNAVEVCVETEETEETISGWSDIILKNKELLTSVTKMLDNKDNSEGKKLAILLLKHEKESVRFLCDLIINNKNFDVEDRTKITL